MPSKGKEFKCARCGLCLSTKSNLNRHAKTSHKKKIKGFRCLDCGNLYSRKDSLLRHHRSIHSENELVFDTLRVKRVFKPKIDKVLPWNPPFEAVARKPIIRAVSKIVSDPYYKSCTIADALRAVRKPTYEELMEDLYLTPSPSLSPSSSSSTICLDELNNEKLIMDVPCIVESVYGRCNQPEQNH